MKNSDLYVALFAVAFIFFGNLMILVEVMK